jgi:hypothetical protein
MFRRWDLGPHDGRPCCLAWTSARNVVHACSASDCHEARLSPSGQGKRLGERETRCIMSLISATMRSNWSEYMYGMYAEFAWCGFWPEERCH